MAPELLVAIDGSKHSERIVSYAASLAKRLSANIALLYVSPATGVPEDFKEYARTENLSDADYYDAVGAQILAKYCQVSRGAGVECEAIAEAGNVAENVLAVAKERATLS